jgi:hypothetical protein
LGEGCFSECSSLSSVIFESGVSINLGGLGATSTKDWPSERDNTIPRVIYLNIVR